MTRSSTGEPDSQAERNEFAGTAAEAQAFKRACSAFGLGRYLYSLPTLWVEYDAQAKSFTDKAKARLAQILSQHYRREMEGNEAAPATSNTAASPAVATDLEQRAVDLLTKSTDQPAAQLVQQFDALGQELYGEQWEHVRRHNVERISNSQTADCKALTVEQLQKLIDGLKSLKQKRSKATRKQPVPNGQPSA